jgi:perosamine synthetase
MTIPEPPLPTLRMLAGAFLGPAPAAAGNEHWYATASEALAAAIRALAKGEPATVWFPAYFCNEALRFIRHLPVSLRFYDVNPDLGAAWDGLERRIRSAEGSSILVLVHYFGFPNRTDAAAAFCRERSLTLLEDAAHVAARATGIGRGAAVVFSPRKLLPVPMGGLLSMKPGLEASLPSPASVSHSAEIRRWAVRRLAQRGLTRIGAPWHRLAEYRFPTPASTVGALYERARAVTDRAYSACSPYVRRLIASAERELPEIVSKRRERYMQLLERGRDWTAIEPLFRELPEGVCPYVFPILVPRNVDRWTAFLRSNGVPASRWPDLPLEVQTSGDFPESSKLASQTVLLPVHQSLTAAQMDRMRRVLESSMDIVR